MHPPRPRRLQSLRHHASSAPVAQPPCIPAEDVPPTSTLAWCARGGGAHPPPQPSRADRDVAVRRVADAVAAQGRVARRGQGGTAPPPLVTAAAVASAKGENVAALDAAVGWRAVVPRMTTHEGDGSHAGLSHRGGGSRFSNGADSVRRRRSQRQPRTSPARRPADRHRPHRWPRLNRRADRSRWRPLFRTRAERRA